MIRGNQFIGRRPIAAFGNSDGDQAMLEYTTIDNPNPSFGLIVHHTDAQREYAYDAKPKSSGKLITALHRESTCYFSSGNTVFQSSFISTTVQPFLGAAGSS